MDVLRENEKFVVAVELAAVVGVNAVVVVVVLVVFVCVIILCVFLSSNS